MTEQQRMDDYAAGQRSGVASEAAPSTPELAALRERAIDANERYRNALMWLARITTCVVIAALGVLIYIATQNYHNGQRLVDCTTPGHECYDRAQEQTGEAVQNLIDSIKRENRQSTQTILRELKELETP